MPATPVKVTVLMTLYNKGPYVAEAIHSILTNTFTDLELLVVDDGSTDGGLEKVKAIADPRIRILESALNTGRAAAANRGFDEAHGEYIAILDADDQMHPDRLAKQVAFMDAHPEVGVCGSWLQAFGITDRILEKPSTDAEIRSRLLLGIPLTYGACMLRSSILKEHEIRCDPTWLSPGMDHLFLLKVGMHSAYANIPEALTQYRVGEQNMDHGRDRTADRRSLLMETLRVLDIPATQEEMDLHLMLANLHTVEPTAIRVRALARWMQRLKAHNRKVEQFPVSLFEAHLDRLWNKAFFSLADRSLQAGWTHLRLTDRPVPGKWYYLFRRLGRSRGSVPSHSNTA